MDQCSKCINTACSGSGKRGNFDGRQHNCASYKGVGASATNTHDDTLKKLFGDEFHLDVYLPI